MTRSKSLSWWDKAFQFPNLGSLRGFSKKVLIFLRYTPSIILKQTVCVFVLIPSFILKILEGLQYQDDLRILGDSTFLNYHRKNHFLQFFRWDMFKTIKSSGRVSKKFNRFICKINNNIPLLWERLKSEAKNTLYVPSSINKSSQVTSNCTSSFKRILTKR